MDQDGLTQESTNEPPGDDKAQGEQIDAAEAADGEATPNEADSADEAATMDEADAPDETATMDEADADTEPQTEGEADAPAERTVANAELELAAIRVQADEYKDKLLRTAAEFDNFRRRASREQEDARRFGVESLLKDLLPVADNLERALTHAGTNNDADFDVLRQGVEMVLRHFLDRLSQYGVQPFDSKGKPFDPSRHEAIHQKATDEVEPGTVVEEFQRGYLLHDRLARAAMVVVSTAPSPDVKPADEEAPEADETVQAEGDAEPEEVKKEAPEDAPGDPEELDLAEIEGAREMVVGASVVDAPAELLDYHSASAGAVVTAVNEMTPAARAGLQPGDLITGAAGRAVLDARGFSRVVRQFMPRGQGFTVVYWREQGQESETRLGGPSRA